MVADCATADNEKVIEVEPDAFEDMVVAALDSLPEDLGRLMRNVAVTVEHGPGRPGLLGLYQGIPLTSRTSQYAGVLPETGSRSTGGPSARSATPRPRWWSRSAGRLSTRSRTTSASTTPASPSLAGDGDAG